MGQSFTAKVSKTAATVAGFGDEGPSEGWVRERLRQIGTSRLSNYEPVLPQMRRWESPIVVFAEPS